MWLTLASGRANPSRAKNDSASGYVQGWCNRSDSAFGATTDRLTDQRPSGRPARLVRVDKAAAGEILRQVLAPLRALSYEDLVERFVDRSAEQMTLPNPSGEPYQIEVLGVWDDRRSGKPPRACGHR